MRAKGKSNCKKIALTKGTRVDAGIHRFFCPPYPLAATCGGLVGITQHLVTGGRPSFLRARRVGVTKTTMRQIVIIVIIPPIEIDRRGSPPALDRERARPAPMAWLPSRHLPGRPVAGCFGQPHLETALLAAAADCCPLPAASPCLACQFLLSSGPYVHTEIDARTWPWKRCSYSSPLHARTQRRHGSGRRRRRAARTSRGITSFPCQQRKGGARRHRAAPASQLQWRSRRRPTAS